MIAHEVFIDGLDYAFTGLTEGDLRAHAERFTFEPDWPSLETQRRQGWARADFDAWLEAARIEHDTLYAMHMLSLGAKR